MLAQEKVRKDIMMAMVARMLMQAMAVIHGRTTMTMVETKYHVVMKLAMDLQQQDGLGPMMAKGAQVEDGKRIRTMFPSSLVRPLHEGDVGSVVLVASSSSNNHDGGRGRSFSTGVQRRCGIRSLLSSALSAGFASMGADHQRVSSSERASTSSFGCHEGISGLGV